MDYMAELMKQKMVVNIFTAKQKTFNFALISFFFMIYLLTRLEN